MRFLIGLLLITSFSFSQELKWSEELKTSNYPIGFYPISEDTMVVVARGGMIARSDYFFYNVVNGKFVSENKMSSGFLGGSKEIIEVLLLDGKLTFFYTENHPKGVRLYAQSLGMHSEPVGEPKMLVDHLTKARLLSSNVDFRITQSANEKFYAVTSIDQKSNRLESPYLISYIFDQNHQLLSSAENQIGFRASDSYSINYKVSDLGNLMLLISGFDTRPSDRRGYYNLEFFVQKKDGEMVHNNLKDFDGSMSKVTFTQNSPTSYSIAYTFNDLTAKNKPQAGFIGIRSYFFDENTFALSERKESVIDRQTIFNTYTDKQRAKYDKAISKGKAYNLALSDNNRLHSYSLLKDSSKLATFESFYIRVVQRSSGRMSYTYTYYHYDDIKLMKFDAQDVIDYSKSIPKHQVSEGVDLFNSYISLRDSSHLIFVFNDNIDNYLNGSYVAGYNPRSLGTNVPRKTCTALLKVGMKDGEEERTVLWNPSDDGRFVNTDLSTYSVKQGVLYLFYVQKNRIAIGSVKL